MKKKREKEQYRMIKGAVERHDCSITRRVRGAKHTKLHISHHSGRTRILVVPCSPSDHRSVLNLRSQARRLAQSLQVVA